MRTDRRGAVAALLLGMLCAAPVAAQTQADSASSAEGVAAAHEVLRIFHAKCYQCHHPAQEVEGDFGYVMDLAKLAANPDLVVPHEPEASELWFILDFDEMPDPNSDVPPLTPEEKAAVKRWIALGAEAVAWEPPEAPAEDISEAAAHTQETQAEAASDENAPEPEPQLNERPTLAQLWAWIGKLHPASVHLPIAMALAAVAAELLLIGTGRRSMVDVVRFCLWLGLLGGLAAAALGWLHAAPGSGAVFIGERRDALELHRWLGVAGAGCLLVTAALSEARVRRDTPGVRLTLRAALLVMLGLMIATGFLGGGLTHGLDHYRW